MQTGVVIIFKVFIICLVWWEGGNFGVFSFFCMILKNRKYINIYKYIYIYDKQKGLFVCLHE